MTANDSAKSHWWNDPRTAVLVRRAMAGTAAIPVILVNTTAFFGQLAFLNQHVTEPFFVRVIIAVTAECVAIFIAFHAHLAQMKNDSAARLKLGSYLFAALIGAANYSHFAGPHWRPTFMAVIMAAFSALSPWLWGIHSRRASRDALMERGLVEERGIKLGFARWMWHPYRCVIVTSWCAWHGVNDPKTALARYATRWGAVDTPYQPRHERTAVPAGLVRPAVTAPVRTAPAVPDAEPGAVPVPAAAPVPVQSVQAALVQAGGDPFADARVIPGTQLNGKPVVVHHAEAYLEAAPAVKGTGPTPEMIQEAELRLAGCALHELPSEREVAGWLGSRDGQRRTAKRLRDARIADARIAGGTSMTDAPAAAYRSSSFIATPQSQLPGGVSG